MKQTKKEAKPVSRSGFMPIDAEDLRERGIDTLDYIIVTGDAYVDHPSFGTAIVGRVVEDNGYTVGVIAQPDLSNDKDLTRLGRPKYAFLINSGNLDSMVAHYTVAKKRRGTDFYSPGGKTGRRPDHAVVRYCQQVRRLYPDCPIIIGGLEASLRRLAHYDYWADKVFPSILIDSDADLLIYGMGELQIKEIVTRLGAGENIRTLTDIRGTCYPCPVTERPYDAAECASFEIVSENKTAYAKATRKQYEMTDYMTARTLVQRNKDRLIVQNPPMRPLNTEELDHVFDLPYMRTYHPCYEAEGGVPAIDEVEFSINHNRGCFGGCNFCSIVFHQGRYITCRSEENILREAKLMTESPNFKGYISDVGGPTANFRIPSCKKQCRLGMCNDRKCLAPEPCPNLQVDHSEYLSILRKLRALPGVKKVFIRSGIRYDYLNEDEDKTFLRELIQYHISGQLRVAPEHCSAAVLDEMGKPHFEAYTRFSKEFYEETKKQGKEQYLVPYLMSSHPGSTRKEAIELSLFLKKNHLHPEQVQDFYPTPGTISTCMFYTGLDPFTMKPVYVPTTPAEKAAQRALLQYYRPENYGIVYQTLIREGRRDLIGTGPNCLIPPPQPGYQQKNGGHQDSRRPNERGKSASRGGKQEKKSGNSSRNPRGNDRGAARAASAGGHQNPHTQSGGRGGFPPKSKGARPHKGR